MKARIIMILITFLILYTGDIVSQSEFSIIVSKNQLNDEAVSVALDDLINRGKELGISFQIVSTQIEMEGSAIIVGNAERNGLAEKIMAQSNIQQEKIDNLEGYEIKTRLNDEQKYLFVSGGSAIGDIYGLYWILDRMRVFKNIPDINIKREPALSVRYSRVRVKTKDDIKRALSFGLNLVYVGDPLELIPWGTEPEDTENKKNRAEVKELINYAHKLHMQCLAFGTDFTYHPILLKEYNAHLSPCDEGTWNALQEKYRRLFRELPELDGVATFTGPEQSFSGNYKKFDLMHDDQNCEWPLEKRYSTFVKKVHEVAVEEFHKIYHHRTWMTNTYEQQARHEVYKNIFTDEVPVENLFLIPSFTQNDRWWHQRYNPTFNITPHQMLAVLEPMNYYESSKSNIFPTYPGLYFQAGLQSILEVPNSNLKGVSFDLYAPDDFRTSRLTAYTVFRLGWNYMEDPLQIAEDFCSIYFGVDAAKGMADIYMLSPVAYKYGLFIEPVAYGEFNSLPHIRVGTFPAQGYPAIDNGKEHLSFWRKIYLRCKPWISETYDDLDHGLQVANQMRGMYNSVKPQIKDTLLALQADNSLKMTQKFIQTNNLYVKTVFAYFAYRDDPSKENMIGLANIVDQLKGTVRGFKDVPQFNYKLFGVEQLLANADQILTNRTKAMELLEKAPSSQQIEKSIEQMHEKYKNILVENESNLIKILHFEGQIDGRDILKIYGNTYEIEHLRWDPPTIKECTFFNPLPQNEGSIVLKLIQSQPVDPFILQQPTKENDYTAHVYMYDKPEGRDWVEFDLYYLNKSPKELGLEVPW